MVIHLEPELFLLISLVLEETSLICVSDVAFNAEV